MFGRCGGRTQKDLGLLQKRDEAHVPHMSSHQGTQTHKKCWLMDKAGERRHSGAGVPLVQLTPAHHLLSWAVPSAGRALNLSLLLHSLHLSLQWRFSNCKNHHESPLKQFLGPICRDSDSIGWVESISLHFQQAHGCCHCCWSKPSSTLGAAALEQRCPAELNVTLETVCL